MKLPRRKFLHLAAGAAALACTAMLFSSDGTSQDQEMKIVVTFPRGSGGDLMTRIAAEHISRKHGVSVTFENSAAAAGTAAVARAAPAYDQQQLCCGLKSSQTHARSSR